MLTGLPANTLPDTPLPPPAPRGVGFPASSVLWSALTTAFLPARSAFASLRGTYLSTRCFALSTAGCVPPPESWELLCGIPHPLVLLIGVAVPLKFLGNPDARTPRSETPPGPAHRLYASWLLLTMRPNRSAIGLGISRLSDAAYALPVYASKERVAPHRRKTRFRRSPTLPGGLGYPLGSDSRFHFFALHLLSGLS